MAAYYNEIDPFAVEWLKALISEGHIAQGDVDDRSIEEVRASDLNGYTQCHFFAGIGVWSYALRQAGITDDTPVWTGSCPCQPFSSAGRRTGTADERHLWPQLYRLVTECRPPRVLGEQVAGKAGAAWFDLVQADLAQENYAAGMVVFPACGLGAPHQRQRLYWVAENTLADSARARSDRISTDNDTSAEMERSVKPTADATHKPRCCETSPLAHSNCNRNVRENRNSDSTEGAAQKRGKKNARTNENRDYSTVSPLADSNQIGCKGQCRCRTAQIGRATQSGAADRPSPTNGFWSDPDWLYCRDDKWRPVRPSSFPLVDGSPNRVGRLRGYGNAIVAPQAQAFIEAVFNKET
jgi:DNA (cytosine-5)-methyltransferase 1